MSFELVVDEELCSGCGNCIVACPVNALNDIEASGGKGSDLTPLIKIEGGTTYIVDQKACNGCGVCIQACSYNAILVDAAKPEPSSKLVKVKELKIPGEKGQVYEMVKEKGPLTIPQIAKELNLPPRLVIRHVFSLKKDNKIWDHGRVNGDYLYTAEKIEIVEAEEKEVIEEVMPPAGELEEEIIVTPEFMVGEAAAEFVKACYQCGVCSGICQKAEAKPDFVPRRMVFDTITGFSSRVLSSGDGWECLTCGECQAQCPMKVDFLGMIRELRKGMLKEGVACHLAHDKGFEALYDIMKDRRIKPKRKHLLEEGIKVNDESDTLYFMGCLTYFDTAFRDDVGLGGMKIANDTIKLLNAVGIVPAVLDEEKCCGHDQLWRGQVEIFGELGKQNREILTKYKTIVVNCPECYRTLALDYKEKLGIELNVKHISEVLVENMHKLSKKGSAAKVTFQDSCRLGRHMGIYDAPRRLLNTLGYELQEMGKNKERSLCCGVPAFVDCGATANMKIRRRKMKDALETGAEILVTPCPKCQIHLKCLQMSEPEYNNIRIVDLSTALIENLER